MRLHVYSATALFLMKCAHHPEHRFFAVFKIRYRRIWYIKRDPHSSHASFRPCEHYKRGVKLFLRRVYRTYNLTLIIFRHILPTTFVRVKYTHRARSGCIRHSNLRRFSLKYTAAIFALVTMHRCAAIRTAYGFERFAIVNGFKIAQRSNI